MHTSTLHDARSASELSSSDGILQILPFLSNSSLPQRWHLAQLSHIGPRYKDTRHITTVELNDGDEENIGYQIAELFSKMQDLEKLYRI